MHGSCSIRKLHWFNDALLMKVVYFYFYFHSHGIRYRSWSVELWSSLRINMKFSSDPSHHSQF